MRESNDDRLNDASGSNGVSRRQLLAATAAGIASSAGCLGILGSDESSLDAGPWSQKRGGPRNRSYGPQRGPGEDLVSTFTWTHPEAKPQSPFRGQLDYSACTTDGERLYCSVNGTVFSGSDERSDVKEVLALDPGSRDVLWTGDPSGYAATRTVNPPAVADGVVLHCGTQPIALDAVDGTELWTRELTTQYRPPTIADGTVYLPTSNGIHAVDLETGDDVWTGDAEQSDPIPRSKPAVGDAVYASARNELVAFDPDTGEERWRERHDAFQSVRTAPGEPGPLGAPVLGSDAVYVAGGVEQLNNRDHGGLAAFDPADGSALWQFDFEAAFDRSIPREPETVNGRPTEEFEATGVFGAPALADGVLYGVGYVVGSPKLLAVDAASGELQWDADVPSVANHVLVGGDVVYVVRAVGVDAYHAVDGTHLRTTEPEDFAWPSHQAGGSLTDGRLLVPSGVGLRGYGG